MLLDPFEEQLDLPSASIKLGDGEGCQREVVGQEYQALAGLGVFEFDAMQWGVEVLARVETCEHNGLIADQPSTSIDLMRVAMLSFEVGPRTRDKEAAGRVQAIQALEVDIASKPQMRPLLAWRDFVNAFRTQHTRSPS